MPGVTLRDSKSSIQTDPIRNFKFMVHIPKANIPGIMDLGFMSCSGLAATTDMIPYREGGDNTTTRKMPGQTNFGAITLSRGMVIGTEQMWRWFTEIFYVVQGGSGGHGPAGNNFRTNMYVNVLAHPITSGPTPIKAQFLVYNAWPTTIAYSDFDAGGNGVMIEQLTLEHEGFKVAWATGAGDDSSLSESPNFGE